MTTSSTGQAGLTKQEDGTWIRAKQVNRRWIFPRLSIRCPPRHRLDHSDAPGNARPRCPIAPCRTVPLLRPKVPLLT